MIYLITVEVNYFCVKFGQVFVGVGGSLLDGRPIQLLTVHKYISLLLFEDVDRNICLEYFFLNVSRFISC